MGAVLCIAAGAASAQDAAQLEKQMEQMQQQMQELQRQIQQLKQQQQQQQAQEQAQQQQLQQQQQVMQQLPSPEKLAKAAEEREPLLHEIIKGFYGTLDVSLDEMSKGINQLPPAYSWSYVTVPGSGYVRSATPKAGPVGQLGYQIMLGTNKPVLGYRGSHHIGETAVDFLYQIEAQPALTAAPGLYTSYTQQSNVVRAGLGYGDTYVGLGANPSSLDWGRVKFGVTYAPYKKSTDRLNPFSGMIGDYAVVMGNTGGDNRVEFGTRLEHSIWYESPMLGPFAFDVLFSPGQNRTYNNVVQSAGSSDCNGGNSPGSGNLPLNCDDGGFGTAWSADLRFELDGWYATAAYELHKDVNRASDGIGSNNPYYAYLFSQSNNCTSPAPLLDCADYNAYLAEYGQAFVTANGFTPELTHDVVDERGIKGAVEYTFDFGLSIGTIYEWLWRDLPPFMEWQNERTRDGWWFVVTQDIGVADNVSLGYAHAGRTPGDPGGQHNYNPTLLDDSAHMFTAAWKHRFDKHFYAYFDFAETVNHGNVHYDLGAGGRALTTDCHDGTNNLVNDYSSYGPTTWGGCRPIGFSTGMDYKF